MYIKIADKEKEIIDILNKNQIKYTKFDNVVEAFNYEKKLNTSQSLVRQETNKKKLMLLDFLMAMSTYDLENDESTLKSEFASHLISNIFE